MLDELQRRHPGKYPRKLLRTLQRRMSKWRALHGPDQEVVFPQDHPPGREAAFDFTHGAELEVTIAGEPFDHLFFTLKASCSGWLYAELAFGETWEAACQGLQNAMFEAGGVFAVWRHDNLSAATRELKDSGGRTLTRRFQELVDHYGARSTRIRPGKPNENGVAEKGNDLLKTALDQALRLRADRDFPTVEVYVAFAREVVARHNADREDAIRVVDLAGLARLVVEEQDWPDVECRGSGTAMVDRHLVARLFGNLLRNSQQHAPGARRWIGVADHTIWVGDDGPGLPVDQQEVALHAFARGAASTGHGLGLAIVAQIATIHGGTVALSEPPGLTVRVTFATDSEPPEERATA